MLKVTPSHALHHSFHSTQPKPDSLFPSLLDCSLLTDLYELTMAACYVGENLDQRWASFELFTRRLPDGFGYLVAMGLEQALEYLEAFQFSDTHIEALKSLSTFAHAPEAFWSLLHNSRFTGDVWAVPEGTAMFVHEPLLRIEAPLWQAQLLETYLLNTLNYQTLVATRAAQIRDIVGDIANVLEFGSRRAFSPQASLWAARAALAAGFDGTSNVLAALKLGHTPKGTMAHSLVMALSAVNSSEDDAFTAFHRYFPGATLLIDTYNTKAAAQRLAEQVAAGTMTVDAVRLDSGDLVELSKMVRSLLPHTTVFASGDLDGAEIARLQANGAMIDGYGIGTKLVTGQPVNGVYKLVEIDGVPTMKGATGKNTYPGRKQVFRQFDQTSRVVGDRLGLMSDSADQSLTNAPSNNFSLKPPVHSEYPLLQCVMKQGRRLTDAEPLGVIAQRTYRSVAQLPPDIRKIHAPATLNPLISSALKRLTKDTQKIIHQTYTQ